VGNLLATRHGFPVARNTFLVARDGMRTAIIAVLQTRNPFLGVRNPVLARRNVYIMVIVTFLAKRLLFGKGYGYQPKKYIY
jgi:hypothetical protein